MKIYKSDGSCIDNPADTEFGWNLNEENVLFHNKFCKTPNKEVKLWENPIQTAQISSVVDFELASGLDEIAETPQKSQICSLINPCTVESKVLLSVVHNAMYRNFDRRMLNLEHFKNGTRLPLCQDIESVIFNQIQDFSRDENNVLSLMMDLILTENRCDRHELCDNLQFQNRDFVDRIQHKHFCERVREKCLSYSEFEDVINRIVQEISDRTVDLDLEIDKIKKSFEVNDPFGEILFSFFFVG